MACARNLGLTALPIVCVSVNGYYDSFRDMLDRAYKEELVKNKPEDVVHFVPTAEEAVRWIELQKEKNQGKVIPKIKTRASILKRASFLSPPVLARSVSWISGNSSTGVGKFLRENRDSLVIGAIAFVAGASIGFASARKQSS